MFEALNKKGAAVTTAFAVAMGSVAMAKGAEASQRTGSDANLTYLAQKALAGSGEASLKPNRHLAAAEADNPALAAALAMLQHVVKFQEELKNSREPHEFYGAIVIEPHPTGIDADLTPYGSDSPKRIEDNPLLGTPILIDPLVKKINGKTYLFGFGYDFTKGITDDFLDHSGLDMAIHHWLYERNKKVSPAENEKVKTNAEMSMRLWTFDLDRLTKQASLYYFSFGGTKPAMIKTKPTPNGKQLQPNADRVKYPFNVVAQFIPNLTVDESGNLPTYQDYMRRLGYQPLPANYKPPFLK